MILSFSRETREQDDLNNDFLKIDTINEIEELLSKQSNYNFNKFSL
mgnify:CR=1 FL=1